MEKRKLGSTGIDVSILGLGGFHLLERKTEDVVRLVDYFIDHGGNYLEAAAQYGDGEAEQKLGYALKGKRDKVVLASKVHKRDYENAEKLLDRTLKNLNTDYIDVWFLHHVTVPNDLRALLDRPSALDVAERAKREGKIRAIGVSTHGMPDIAMELMESFPIDVVMTHFNYFDKFNFPKIEDELIPLARKKGMGIVGMKAFADGFLHEHPEDALRYALSLDIDTMVVGANTLELLEKDIKIVDEFRPMDKEEMEKLFFEAEELGNYVCRQCNKCLPCPEGINIPKIFEYEGWYDRQMRDYRPHPTEEHIMREHLAFWFNVTDDPKDDSRSFLYLDRPINAYKSLDKNYLACTNCGLCTERCPYGIDVVEKLKIVHKKLSGEEILV